MEGKGGGGVEGKGGGGGVGRGENERKGRDSIPPFMYCSSFCTEVHETLLCWAANYTCPARRRPLTASLTSRVSASLNRSTWLHSTGAAIRSSAVKRYAHRSSMWSMASSVSANTCSVGGGGERREGGGEWKVKREGEDGCAKVVGSSNNAQHRSVPSSLHTILMATPAMDIPTLRLGGSSSSGGQSITSTSLYFAFTSWSVTATCDSTEKSCTYTTE